MPNAQCLLYSKCTKYENYFSYLWYKSFCFPILWPSGQEENKNNRASFCPQPPVSSHPCLAVLLPCLRKPGALFLLFGGTDCKEGRKQQQNFHPEMGSRGKRGWGADGLGSRASLTPISPAIGQLGLGTTWQMFHVWQCRPYPFLFELH